MTKEETKQIQLPSGNYLLVTIPEDAKDFVIDDELFYKAYYMGLENIGQMKKLPPGQWSIIGKPLELKEDDWKWIVAQNPGLMMPMKYADYTKPNYHYEDTATKSGLSLIASQQMNASTTLILKKIQP